LKRSDHHLSTIAGGLAIGATLTLGLPGCEPPNISVTETPIKVLQQTEGYGQPVRKGDLVRVNYCVSLPDGREVLRQQEFRFRAGADSVIRGVDEAVLGMRAGGQRTFICPPHKHWGRAGYGDGVVPPSTDLTIQLMLLEVERRANPPRVGSSNRVAGADQ
jgi:FKBP-type peptidyl-prolyl cis-trans isomerase